MIGDMIQYALALWSIFFLWNYSLILKDQREYLAPKFPYPLSYITACSFCMAFWLSFFIALWRNDWMIVLVAPALCRLIDLTYLALIKVTND